MSQIIPIYVPLYVASETYQPARVLPRLLFFNGLVQCERWWIKQADNSSISKDFFPYFDNYNVVTGSFPTTDSKTLLFQNENSVYGSAPTGSLYSEYWETYINLLYNPTTRLLNASAIIPLKDYFDMELNDIVNFRGNYYHLRAINDYSLKTGNCNIQLLGPIIPDALSDTINPTTTTTTTTTSTTTTSTTTTSTTTTTTTTTAPPTYNYLIEECDSLDLYNAAQIHPFSVGDVVQFQAGTPGAGTIFCGTITSDTFPTSSTDATLWSTVAYECGDVIHCNIEP